MAASQFGYDKKTMKLSACAGLVVAMLGLGGCASMIAAMIPPQRVKLEDYIACDKHQSPEKNITKDICEQVNDLLHKEAGLPDAVVGFDVRNEGRLQLAGKYKNEEELEKAFAYAQAMVGGDGVSPVKPGHIQVEGWQQCLTEKFAGRQCSEAEQQGFEINKKPPGPVRDKYALVVGVGQFKNINRPLNFAVKDASAVSAYLTDPRLGGFPSSHVTVLTDAQATHQAILDALDGLERNAKPDDLVVLYFSSHGAPPNMFGHVNIVTYDTELLFGKQGEELGWRDKILRREALWKTSIPQERLHEFFRKVRSKRVLMVLDVCYSGDVFTQLPGFKPTASEVLAKNEENFGTGISAEQLAGMLGGSKDLIVEDGGGKASVAPPSVPRSRTKHKPETSPVKVSGNPAKAWGKVIVSASDKSQKSWEPPPGDASRVQNSYFTHYLLQNLQKNGGRIQDSVASSIPLVNEAVQHEKGKAQNPQFFSVPNLDDWNFSINAKR
jgi:hypothetical protein